MARIPPDPVTVRIKVDVPVWIGPAMWLTARAYAIKAAITGKTVSDETVESIARWFANRLVIKAV